MNSFGLRRRLLFALLATAVVAVAALVAGFNLLLADTLDRNARDLVRSRADAQRNSLRVERGRLTTGEAPDDRSSDAYVWVFSGRRVIERPRVAPDVDATVRSLLDGPPRFADLPASDTRLYVLPVLVHARRAGTIVAGVSLAPYEETRETALIASLIFGAVVIVLGTAFGWWLLGASLRSVVRMTRQAAAWSEHELDHRFALGSPHDELTELAATLDGLLDRVAAGLRRERRFSAELSHELRTPLARVLAQTEHALRRERTPAEYRQTLELIHGNADRLSRTVDALVAAARYETGGERGIADAESVAAGAAAACAQIAEQRRIAIEVAPPARALRLGLDTDLAERILQPVIENACRYGTTRVRVALDRGDATVVYSVEDDGPGVAAAEQEHIFEPGVRGSAASANGDAGAGLGLSLARRLARSVDGDVEAIAAAGGRFTVRLPTG